MPSPDKRHEGRGIHGGPNWPCANCSHRRRDHIPNPDAPGCTRGCNVIGCECPRYRAHKDIWSSRDEHPEPPLTAEQRLRRLIDRPEVQHPETPKRTDFSRASDDFPPLVEHRETGERESCDCDPNAPGYANRAGVASCSWCDKPLTDGTPSALRDGGERAYEHRLIDCDTEIRERGPGSLTAQDGDEWTCSCGRLFTHVCDEAEGCGWWYLPERQEAEHGAS